MNHKYYIRSRRSNANIPVGEDIINTFLYYCEIKHVESSLADSTMSHYFVFVEDK